MKLLATLAIFVTAASLAPREATETSPALARIEVIGASMTDGFGVKGSLGSLLKHTLVPETDHFETRGSLFFFAMPLDTGNEQVEEALDAEPTLLVALDFLFWYGYGSTNAEGGLLETEDERLELLEVGLELLDEFECPLLVGDFPDMSGAVGRVLQARQMPAPETLKKLSARVNAWAAEKQNVRVVPLARMVEDLLSDKPLRIGRHDWPAGSTRRLLQADRLHPTLEGLLGMAQYVADRLVMEGLARESEFRFDLPEILKEVSRRRR